MNSIHECFSLPRLFFSFSSARFCLWGADKPNSVVGEVEGEMVAYCTQKKYGARMIPKGSIKGIQL